MDIKSAIVSIIAGIITGISGYLLGIRKRKAETKNIEEESISKEISNLKEIIDSWKEYSLDLEKRVRQQNDEIKLLRKKVEELRKEIKNQCSICDYKKFYEQNKS